MQWEKTFVGLSGEEAFSAQQVSGGYIVAGYTNSFGAGINNAWVVKLDIEGAVLWQNTYYTGAISEAHSILEVEGGYLVAGSSSSTPWLLKIREDGGLLWSKSYVPDGIGAGAVSLRQTYDQGGNPDGYVVGTVGGILKLDRDGNISGCPYIRTTDVIIVPI